MIRQIMYLSLIINYKDLQEKDVLVPYKLHQCKLSPLQILPYLMILRPRLRQNMGQFIQHKNILSQLEHEYSVQDVQS